jgi:amino acid adenylation domain-containing protein
MLTDPERRQIFVDWNNTSCGYPSDNCLHQLFEQQVEQTPDAVAVVYEDEQLTYRELNTHANQLAHYLKSFGIGPEVLVGIYLERSLKMVIAVLGILKAGGAYVPLDPTYPKEHLAFMLSDAQIPVLLTQKRLVDTLPVYDGDLICLDNDMSTISQESEENPTSRATPANLVYVIYTSGSTGRPKGVLIPHRALVNHSIAVARQYGLESKDRVLQFASISFDLAAEEIFPSLLNGATVVLQPNQETVSFTEMLQFMEREKLTVLNPPTAYWHEWVSELSRSKAQLPSTVRLVIPGGEKASKEKFATWQKLVGSHVRWINGYGPTEATITATNYEPTSLREIQGSLSVPIGRPIANTRLYILNSHMQPVPIGVYGEIHIGGAGLSRGYLNRPHLTAASFIPNPYSDKPGARLYKSGDLARYLPDGNIEFLGRIDHQVKIRGFRIELGEVESVLGRHPAVEEAVVIAREDVPGDKRLVAYVVSSHEPTLTFSELRSFLKEKLPDYMIPSTFAFLDLLPLTPSGKVDRRALPAPDVVRPELQEAFVAPRSQSEELVAGIWGNVLGVERIGVHDNFFELGGHSLLATRVVSRIQQEFRVDLKLMHFFKMPTIAALAKVIEGLLWINAGRPGEDEAELQDREEWVV